MINFVLECFTKNVIDMIKFSSDWILLPGGCSLFLIELKIDRKLEIQFIKMAIWWIFPALNCITGNNIPWLWKIIFKRYINARKLVSISKCHYLKLKWVKMILMHLSEITFIGELCIRASFTNKCVCFVSMPVLTYKMYSLNAKVLL